MRTCATSLDGETVSEAPDFSNIFYTHFLPVLVAGPGLPIEAPTELRQARQRVLSEAECTALMRKHNLLNGSATECSLEASVLLVRVFCSVPSDNIQFAALSKQ